MILLPFHFHKKQGIVEYQSDNTKKHLVRQKFVRQKDSSEKNFCLTNFRDQGKILSIVFDEFLFVSQVLLSFIYHLSIVRTAWVFTRGGKILCSKPFQGSFVTDAIITSKSKEVSRLNFELPGLICSYFMYCI